MTFEKENEILLKSAMDEPELKSNEKNGSKENLIEKIIELFKDLLCSKMGEGCKNHLELQVEIARSPRSGGVRRSCWVFLKGLSMRF